MIYRYFSETFLYYHPFSILLPNTSLTSTKLTIFQLNLPAQPPAAPLLFAGVPRTRRTMPCGAVRQGGRGLTLGGGPAESGGATPSVRRAKGPTGRPPASHGRRDAGGGCPQSPFPKGRGTRRGGWVLRGLDTQIFLAPFSHKQITFLNQEN